MADYQEAHTFNNLYSALRIPLMMGVVAIHSTTSDFTGCCDSVGLAVVNFLSKILTSCCVPGFFILSGFLFFKGTHVSYACGMSFFKHKFESRTRTLLLPYLIWCSIGLFLTLLKATLLSQYFPRYAAIDISFPSILKGYWSYDLFGEQFPPYPFAFTLWFLRNLICVIVLSPIALLLVRYLKIFGIIVLWGLCLLVEVHNDYSLTSSALFFAVGCYLSYHRTFCLTALRHGYILTAVYLAWCLASQWLDLQLLWVPACVCGYFALLRLTSGLLSRIDYDPRNLISRSLFFVYAFHGLFVSTAAKVLLSALAPCSFAMTVVCFFVLFLLLWLFSIAAFALCNRLCPKLTAIACGDRS